MLDYFEKSLYIMSSYGSVGLIMLLLSSFTAYFILKEEEKTEPLLK